MPLLPLVCSRALPLHLQEGEFPSALGMAGEGGSQWGQGVRAGVVFSLGEEGGCGAFDSWRGGCGRCVSLRVSRDEGPLQLLEVVCGSCRRFLLGKRRHNLFFFLFCLSGRWLFKLHRFMLPDGDIDEQQPL